MASVDAKRVRADDDPTTPLPCVHLSGLRVAQVVLDGGETLECDYLVLSPGIIADPALKIGEAEPVGGLAQYSLDLYAHASVRGCCCCGWCCCGCVWGPP